MPDPYPARRAVWPSRGARHQQTGVSFQLTGNKISPSAPSSLCVCAWACGGLFTFKNAAATPRPAPRPARNDWRARRRLGARRGRVDPPDRPETPRDNPLRGPTAYRPHEYASEGPVLCYQCPVTSIRGVSNAGRHGPSTSTVSSQSTGGKRGGVRGRSGTLRDRIICHH